MAARTKRWCLSIRKQVCARPTTRNGALTAHAHWFTSLAGSAQTHAFLEFARKLTLCRGPELNWRHMVLQTIALPTELPRREPQFTQKLASESNVCASN